MLRIIIIFPKIEDANNIKSLLVRNGFDVHAVCTTGAQAVSVANGLDGGIVVCGYRLPDMHCMEVHDYLPEGFEMLLIASAPRLAELDGSGIMSVPMPLKAGDLIGTLQLMTRRYMKRKRKEQQKPKARGEKERAVIEEAKLILMHRNHMTEEEAHRYIQKNSMDSGVNLLEMAEMIISML
ncbi:MAG: ANTAR domain-containing protein [Lachnospiraceae bacterium]|nr:ANTAR domain-containing protein [Lachnospiraceae bacterium]